MQWTGNIGRTFGQALLALGIIALVLGILGLVIGASMVNKAMENPEVAEEVGDVLEVLVLGGIMLVVGGTIAVVAAIVTLGVARSLRERLARRLGSGEPPKSGASTVSPKSSA